MTPYSFLNKYYINPILTDSGYNIFNTLTYALMAILILYALYKFFLKFKIEVDLKLFSAILPFILFGSMTRAFVDHGYFQMTAWKKILLITPGIWFFSVALGFIALATGIYLKKRHKIPVHRTAILIGAVILLATIALAFKQLAFDSLATAALIITLQLALCAAIYFIATKASIKSLTNQIGFTAIAAQLWDAVNTSTIIHFHNAHEKHPLPRWLINKFGPWSFLVVKLATVLLAVHLIYKYVEDRPLRNTFLLGIAIIGTGEGLRNFISLILA